MEDFDGVIPGLGGGNVIPSEPLPGFYRGPFNPARFFGGSSAANTATTEPMLVGPLTGPTFAVPVQADFIAGIPAVGSLGFGATAIVVEIQGFPLLDDGSYDDTAGTGWWTVGYFSDSGDPLGPTWVPGVNPSDVTLPIDNLGVGIAHANGSGYVQVRVSIYLPDGIGLNQGGAYIDRWDLRFNYVDL
jgi:hypothetical protein